MYNIHEDASSDYHAYFENSAASLNPTVVLGDLVQTDL